MSHDTLLDEGWQRQTTIDEPRLSELAASYRELGYEVLIVHAGVTAGCGECFKETTGPQRVGALYIRRVAGFCSDDTDDDLFSP